MDGILIVDKPDGMTSHDVVAAVRRVLNTKKVGHTGTLDPFATGVMVVLVGRATRLAQFLDRDEKEYEAVVQLGFETDTGDRTGTPRPNQFVGDETAREIDWEGVLEHFRGPLTQTPPMYSAKKIGGRRLYEMARKGEHVDRPAVNIEITELELLDCPPDAMPPAIHIRVVCSAGTYIRTLAEDIGRKARIGAHLAELKRTRAGKFDLSQSVTLEALTTSPEPASSLRPIHEAVSHLPTFLVPPDRTAKTVNGMSTRVGDVNFSGGEAIQMLAPGGELLAIGFYDERESAIQPRVVLV
ncbi:MAG: tRNA pseudouridine(55) synthase TruB [Pyrinomonadaceae bacterium]